jgi:hypothetical protein
MLSGAGRKQQAGPARVGSEGWSRWPFRLTDSTPGASMVLAKKVGVPTTQEAHL